MNVTGLSSLIANTSPVAGVIISVALMLFSGFAMTRLTKLARLPNVTGYILAGILIGPYVLNLVPQRIIDGTDFLSDIALAFIAFSTGEFFKLSVLKKSGMKVVWITIFEAVLASVFIFILTFLVLRLELAFSIVLSALASATAPASTMMTIRQTGAKGDFVDTLLQVVALDDVVGLVLYSIAISVALASLSGASGFSFETLGKPVLLNLLVLALGSAFGLFMKLLMPQKRSKDNKLIISVALLFAFCGVCALLDISPLLGCMMMGTVYTNIADDDKLFKQLNYFSPPILLLFFVRSGMSFQLDALVSSSGDLNGVPLLVIGVSYFLVRILGKYVGAWLGCRLVKKDKLVRNYLGLALIPQAGVAIGLAALGARTLGGTMGSDLQTIILASSVLYELIGPGCAKLALYLSRSYSTRLEDVAAVEEVTETGERKSDVQLLIERIQKIQSELPALDNDISEEEAAFTEAAEEQLAQTQAQRRFFYLRRRHMKTDWIAGLLGPWSAELAPGSILLRLALSMALAAIIGCERSSKRHSAGLRTFILVSLAGTATMLIDQYLMELLPVTIPVLSAAAVIGITTISANSILFSSKNQIKGLTTSVGLWCCGIVGLALGAGLYTLALVLFLALLCSMSGLPALETHLKDRSNHFEVHLELKNKLDLPGFVSTVRALGIRIDDIESNPAYLNSGLSVFTVSFTVSSAELKQYKKHGEIIEALRSLDYVYYIEEMN